MSFHHFGSQVRLIPRKNGLNVVPIHDVRRDLTEKNNRGKLGDSDWERSLNNHYVMREHKSYRHLQLPLPVE